MGRLVTVLESLYITAATLKALCLSDGRMTHIKGRIDGRRRVEGPGSGRGRPSYARGVVNVGL